jgi:hypothetical protein
VITRPSTQENNVFVAPNGDITRKTSQGWQQRNQSTWKAATPAAVKPELTRDLEIRQRATERSSVRQTSAVSPRPAQVEKATVAPARTAPAPNNKKEEDRRR